MEGLLHNGVICEAARDFGTTPERIIRMAVLIVGRKARSEYKKLPLFAQRESGFIPVWRELSVLMRMFYRLETIPQSYLQGVSTAKDILFKRQNSHSTQNIRLILPTAA